MRTLWFSVVFSLASVAFAQPVINYRGVVNAASYAPSGVPAGSIARGSVFTIFGRGLGPSQFVQVSQFPLGAQLGGVSIRIEQGSTVLDAYPIFVSASQVSAILPSDTPLGMVAVRLTFNNQQSNPAVIDVAPSAVGLFALNSGGFGPGVVQNYISATDQPINTARVSARPGQVVTLWGTGLGPIDGADNQPPPISDLAGPIDVFVGGKLASKLYTGRSGCCSGIDQIIFTIPSDTPEGCYVPIQVRTRATVVSNAVTIAVQKDGNPCMDAFNPAAAAFRATNRRGIVLAQRVDSLIDQIVKQTETVTLDSITAVFAEGVPSDTWFSAGLSLPPLGTCIFFTEVVWRTATSSSPLGSRLLDAGPSLTMPGSTHTPELISSAGLYGVLLGKAPLQTNLRGPFFNAGQRYTIKSQGGADIAGFEVGFDFPAPLSWTNRNAINTIGPQSSLSVTWAGGGAADVILITGESTNAAANSQGRFLCTAEPSSGSFTVPPYVLAALPPTPEFNLAPAAALGVGAFNFRAPTSVAIPSLGAAYVLSGTAQKKGVIVQ